MSASFNITLEAEKGTAFKVAQEEGDLRVIASLLEPEKGTIAYKILQEEGGLRIIASLLEGTQYGDYERPPIPDGYAYLTGEWRNGFTIQDERGNQFVWIPVTTLPADGTLDGVNFNEKFGRRNYRGDEFSGDKYHEDMDDGLSKQFESVKKYGGFYISRYTPSLVDGEVCSVKGKMPYTDVDYHTALKEAQRLGTGNVTSHLIYGAEYDTVLAWFLETRQNKKDITEDSTPIGNYTNSENSPQKMVETGSRSEWEVNGICDLAGNVWEWTQESNGESYRALRGGRYLSDGIKVPLTHRVCLDPSIHLEDVSFRVALYIE